MIAPHILKRLPHLAEDAGSIAMLRKLILVLGFHETLSNEQPTARAEELVDGGGAQSVPHELPYNGLTNIRFQRLSSVARVERGQTGIKGASAGLYPLVVTAATRGSCDHYDFEGPAAIVPLVSSTGHGSATLHRLHYQEGPFALGTILCAILPRDPHVMSARFLFEYLTAFKEELIVSRMVGTANVSLTVKSIGAIPVPMLPVATQGQLEGLVTLCDVSAHGKCTDLITKSAQAPRLTQP